jgi:hypothetical protein
MSEDGIRTAPLGTRWVRKMAIIIVVLLAFGSWGLYDAVSVYPARGERYARWAELQYLDAAQRANGEDFGIFERDTSVPNPGEEYERLNEPERKRTNLADSSNTTSTRHLRASMQMARLNWLEGLKRIGQLKPERTTFENPRERLDALRQEVGATASPKPLAGYDIPSQWAIMGVCWGIALVMMVHFVRVASKKYRWDPTLKALTIPGGGTIVPDDLAEVDKRKWDKFIVFLRIKEGRQPLGGQEVRVDLYQHAELEGWVLAMEEEAFGPQEGGRDAEEPAA